MESVVERDGEREDEMKRGCGGERWRESVVERDGETVRWREMDREGG